MLRPGGSLFSGQGFIVVECGMERQHQIRPINTDKVEDMNWGKEDDKEVMELRKRLREIMMLNMMKVRTIEEIVGECETDISCRMVTASRSQEWLVLRVEDMNCS